MNSLTEDEVLTMASEAIERSGTCKLLLEQENGVYYGSIVGQDGNVTHHYGSSSPDKLLAAFAAEQRWLIEEVGEGEEVTAKACPGDTYLAKAQHRLDRVMNNTH